MVLLHTAYCTVAHPSISLLSSPQCDSKLALNWPANDRVGVNLANKQTQRIMHSPVQNITVLYRTLQSCTEHYSPVQNITVLNRTLQS